MLIGDNLPAILARGSVSGGSNAIWVNTRLPVYFTFSPEPLAVVLGGFRGPKIGPVRFTPEKQDCRKSDGHGK